MCDKSIQIISNSLKYGNYLFHKIAILIHLLIFCSFGRKYSLQTQLESSIYCNNTKISKEDEIDGSKNDKFFSKCYVLSMNYGNTLPKENGNACCWSQIIWAWKMGISDSGRWFSVFLLVLKAARWVCDFELCLFNESRQIHYFGKIVEELGDQMH